MALSKATSAAAAPSKHTPLEPPDGAFDVTVSPGEPLQAAIARAKPGATVLLLPGEHAGPVEFPPGAVVHLFGRGRAVLSDSSLNSVVSDAAVGTIAGLILRSTRPAPAPEAGEEEAEHITAFLLRGGHRIQARGFSESFWSSFGSSSSRLLGCFI